MNFEHLIQINDPLNPVCRHHDPRAVVGGTRAARGTAATVRAGPRLVHDPLAHGDTLERELHYGQVTVRDRVTLTPDQSVRYDILPTANYVGGSLTMAIEQPDELQLFLRFEYSTTLPVADDQDADARQTQEIVKSAYRESDIDTVRLIRQFVHGQAKSPLH